MKQTEHGAPKEISFLSYNYVEICSSAESVEAAIRLPLRLYHEYNEIPVGCDRGVSSSLLDRTFGRERYWGGYRHRLTSVNMHVVKSSSATG